MSTNSQLQRQWLVNDLGSGPSEARKAFDIQEHLSSVEGEHSSEKALRPSDDAAGPVNGSVRSLPPKVSKDSSFTNVCASRRVHRLRAKEAFCFLNCPTRPQERSQPNREANISAPRPRQQNAGDMDSASPFNEASLPKKAGVSRSSSAADDGLLNAPTLTQPHTPAIIQDLDPAPIEMGTWHRFRKWRADRRAEKTARLEEMRRRMAHGLGQHIEPAPAQNLGPTPMAKSSWELFRQWRAERQMRKLARLEEIRSRQGRTGRQSAFTEHFQPSEIRCDIESTFENSLPPRIVMQLSGEEGESWKC